MKSTIVLSLILFFTPYFFLQSSNISWELKYHETFDSLIAEPSSWTEDTYGDESPWHVGPFDEDGAYFYEAYGQAFENALYAFRSFRKSFTYGIDD